MIKWLLTIVIALVVFAGVRPILRRLGVARMPGDLRFVFRGREIFLPIASTIVLSLIAIGIGRLF